MKLQTYIDHLDKLIADATNVPPVLREVLQDIQAQLREIQEMSGDDDKSVISIALGIAFCQKIIKPSVYVGTITEIADLLSHLIYDHSQPNRVFKNTNVGAIAQSRNLIGEIIADLQRQGNLWLSRKNEQQRRILLLTLGMKPKQLLRLEEEHEASNWLNYVKKEGLVRYYQKLIQLEVVSQKQVVHYLAHFITVFPHRINFIWALRDIIGSIQGAKCSANPGGPKGKLIN